MSTIIVGDLLYNVVINPASLSAMNIVLAEATKQLRATASAGRALDKAYAGLSAAATTAVAPLEALNAASVTAAQGQLTLTRTTVATDAALDKMQAGLTAAMARIVALEGALRAPVVPANSLAGSLERLSTVSGGASKALGAVGGAALLLPAPLRAASGAADLAAGSIRTLEATAAPIVPMMALITAALVAVAGAFIAVGAGVGNAMNMEQSLTQVAALAHLSADGIEGLKNAVIQTSLKIPVATDKLLEFARVGATLGIHSAAGLIDFQSQMGKLSLVMRDANGHTGDMEHTARDLIKILNATHTPANEMESAFHRLSAAMVVAKLTAGGTIPEISNLAKYWASAGEKVGFTNEQIIAISATLIGSGARAMGAGSALAKALTSVKDATMEAGPLQNNFARTLGVTTERFQALVKASPSEMLVALVKRLESVQASGGSTNRVLEGLGIKSNQSKLAFNELIGSSSKLEATLNATARAGRDAAYVDGIVAKATGNARDQMTLFHNRLSAASNAIGQEFLPMLRQAIDWLNHNGETVGKVAAGIVVLVKVLIDAGQAIVGLGQIVAGPWVAMYNAIQYAVQNGAAVLNKFITTTKAAFANLGQAMKAAIHGDFGSAAVSASAAGTQVSAGIGAAGRLAGGAGMAGLNTLTKVDQAGVNNLHAALGRVGSDIGSFDRVAKAASGTFKAFTDHADRAASTMNTVTDPALKNLGSQMDKLGGKTKSAGDLAGEAVSDLTRRYNAGLITIDKYRAGLKSLENSYMSQASRMKPGTDAWRNMIDAANSAKSALDGLNAADTRAQAKADAAARKREAAAAAAARKAEQLAQQRVDIVQRLRAALSSFGASLDSGSISEKGVVSFQNQITRLKTEVGRLPAALQVGTGALFTQANAMVQTGNGMVKHAAQVKAYSARLRELTADVKGLTLAELEQERARLVSNGNDPKKIAVVDAQIKPLLAARNTANAEIAKSDADAAKGRENATLAEYARQIELADGNLAKLAQLELTWGERVRNARNRLAQAELTTQQATINAHYDALVRASARDTATVARLETARQRELTAAQETFDNARTANETARLGAEQTARDRFAQAQLSSDRSTRAALLKDALDSAQVARTQAEQARDTELADADLTAVQRLAILASHQDELIRLKALEVQASRVADLDAENVRYQDAIDAANRLGIATTAIEEEHRQNLARVNAHWDDDQASYTLNVQQAIVAGQKSATAEIRADAAKAETDRKAALAQAVADNRQAAQDQVQSALQDLSTLTGAQMSAARLTLLTWMSTYSAMGEAGKAAVKEIQTALDKLDGQGRSNGRAFDGSLEKLFGTDGSDLGDLASFTTRTQGQIDRVGKPSGAQDASDQAVAQYDSLIQRLGAARQDLIDKFGQLEQPTRAQLDAFNATGKALDGLITQATTAAGSAGTAAAAAWQQKFADEQARGAVEFAGSQHDLGLIDDAQYQTALDAQVRYWQTRLANEIAGTTAFAQTQVSLAQATKSAHAEQKRIDDEETARQKKALEDRQALIREFTKSFSELAKIGASGLPDPGEVGISDAEKAKRQGKQDSSNGAGGLVDGAMTLAFSGGNPIAIIQGVMQVFSAFSKDISPILAPLATAFGDVFNALKPLVIVGAQLLAALAPLVEFIARILAPVFSVLGAILGVFVKAIATIVRIITFGFVNLDTSGVKTPATGAAAATASTAKVSSQPTVTISLTQNNTFEGAITDPTMKARLGQFVDERAAALLQRTGLASFGAGTTI